jgi:hypothetical protein
VEVLCYITDEIKKMTQHILPEKWKANILYFTLYLIFYRLTGKVSWFLNCDSEANS